MALVRRLGARRFRVALVVGLYAVALAVSPALHHDLDSHLKAPGHCGACLSSPSASSVETGVQIAPLRVASWNGAAGPLVRPPHAAFRTPSIGRAPPHPA